MKNNKYRLFEKDIKVLKSLVSMGIFEVVLCEEPGYGETGWETIWGKEDSTIFRSSKAEEIEAFFSKPFVADNPKLYAYQWGTHCGMWHYTFGWVNRATQEQLEEAMVPQALDQKTSIKSTFRDLFFGRKRKIVSKANQVRQPGIEDSARNIETNETKVPDASPLARVKENTGILIESGRPNKDFDGHYSYNANGWSTERHNHLLYSIPTGWGIYEICETKNGDRYHVNSQTVRRVYASGMEELITDPKEVAKATVRVLTVISCGIPKCGIIEYPQVLSIYA